MMTDAMNCERFNDQLMDYLERDVDAATRASVERHAVTCDVCGTLLADIRNLRVEAANLPEVAPSQDLWSGIAARIQTPVVPIGVGGASIGGVEREAAGGSRVGRRWAKAGLMAASLVLAAAIGYGARDVAQDVAQQRAAPIDPSVVRPDVVVPEQVAQTNEPAPAASGTRVTPDGRAPSPAPATTGPATTASAAGVTGAAAAASAARPLEVQLAVARLTADYDREITRLRALIDQRRSQLDPMTVSVIERNLAVIDTAIAESRRAIASDPSSRFLIEFLNQSLRDKVELMRTAALLPSRT